MEEGIFVYDGINYLFKEDHIWFKPGIIRPWKKLPKTKSDRMLKEIKLKKESNG